MHAPDLQLALENAREHLLAQRMSGHWEGALSSSALSTAITVCAFKAYCAARTASAETDRLRELCERGLRWLAAHQNEDGGWGDTTLSFSNISTTALCWAAFAGEDATYAQTIAACEHWLQQVVEDAAEDDRGVSGKLDRADLAAAITLRYGRDHTFSVPILTTLALTGRLGPAAEAWQLVPQLPFELAAFPRSWYAWLGLPVVSYALPALIAIGQVRHVQAPTWNLPLRLLRNWVQEPTLRVLEEIQPASGGFLEASPLTSFVALSLVGAGRADHPVVERCLGFLVDSARPDGSWAIDSNLATWVTTLSIRALHAGGEIASLLSPDEGADVREWLLTQQYRTLHPYTLAAPGAWAWTDLPGGVPDADDTPGALLALEALDDGSPAVAAAAEAGVRWLLDLQNDDGGMPTFCRGWGTLPFDRSSADLTAHALRAWLAWHDRLAPAIQERIQAAMKRAWQFLAEAQREDGAWTPLWFGNQYVAGEENPVYGTSRVLLALAAALERPDLPGFPAEGARRAVQWLLACQNAEGGWGGEPRTPSSIEETSLAVEALAAALESDRLRTDDLTARVESSISRAIASLIEQTDGGRRFPPTPIGFYFAKLWYFEQLYPVIFATAALGRAARLAAQASERASPEDALR